MEGGEEGRGGEGGREGGQRQEGGKERKGEEREKEERREGRRVARESEEEEGRKERERTEGEEGGRGAHLRVFCTSSPATTAMVVGREAAHTPSRFNVFSSIPDATTSRGAH